METTNTAAVNTTHPVLGDPIGVAPPMEWTEKDQRLADANGHIEKLTEALTELVHLHACEQEGLQSGKPTPEQWFNAVNKAHDVLWPKSTDKYNPPYIEGKTDLQNEG